MSLQSIKTRFGIIGNSPALNHALDTAIQVAPTELTVLIMGESGVGKEAFSQIIHSLSARKHNSFIAVNCGAIPEGTIDSELFGHEKGSFTGAVESRKGYFETVSGGTIFLDEIGEMPLGTQARLLRVLETGEFIRVGSSKVQKTDVRVIAATNRELRDAAERGKFREDLYYRLNTVPIRVPCLRERKEDINLLFRKFVVDFSDKYKTTPIQLTPEAKNLLAEYPFPGNIRELKNIAEQVSVLTKKDLLDEQDLQKFIPERGGNRLPVLVGHNNNQNNQSNDFSNEREILYKLFFDMKNDVTELKKMFLEILKNPALSTHASNLMHETLLSDLPSGYDSQIQKGRNNQPTILPNSFEKPVLLTEEEIQQHEEVEEGLLSLASMEKDLIIKVLAKHKFKRKDAALELGISERTLYRKIKDYDLEDDE
ncbi:MAG: sigma-54 dependent transcriptional regulator [Bacteroidota bacterium]